ncbi:zinc finger, PMZ-type containing protein [Tanacetum coccineum]
MGKLRIAKVDLAICGVGFVMRVMGLSMGAGIEVNGMCNEAHTSDIIPKGMTYQQKNNSSLTSNTTSRRNPTSSKYVLTFHVQDDKNKGKVSEGSSDKDKGKVGEGSSNKDKGTILRSSSMLNVKFRDSVQGHTAGWLDGWRKVISLDGCFLTHTCKGQLLTTMGRDANNQMFPIAWVVVGVESKNNCTWFLSLLSDDLNLNNGTGLTVISDGHKGLMEAVKIWLSDAKHRECTRHIYANFKKKWSGLQFKILFWKAAASSMNEQFLQVMEEIKSLDENAYTWLVKRNPNTWCRAYFELDRSCATFENGISESFNSKILSSRGKPIITMLEDIRIYLMHRVWFSNKTAMELNDSITPFARRQLEFFKIKQSGFQEVEVRRQDEAFGVNIHLKKCACKMWELTGIPCVHVVVGYTHLNVDPELGVSEWYSKNKWFASYQYSIRPVPSNKLWKKSELPKPLPSVERKLLGRPRKRRIMHHSENDNEISRVGRVMHCHRCWESGYNKSNYTKAPKPKPDNFYDIPTEQPSQDGSNAEMDKDQYQQAAPTVKEIPKYREDPVMPPSSSGNKRKEPPIKKKIISKKSNLVNEASEHAEMMDREAFAEMDWEFREEQEKRIGIMLSKTENCSCIKCTSSTDSRDSSRSKKKGKPRVKKAISEQQITNPRSVLFLLDSKLNTTLKAEFCTTRLVAQDQSNRRSCNVAYQDSEK